MHIPSSLLQPEFSEFDLDAVPQRRARHNADKDLLGPVPLEARDMSKRHPRVVDSGKDQDVRLLALDLQRHGLADEGSRQGDKGPGCAVRSGQITSRSCPSVLPSTHQSDHSFVTTTEIQGFPSYISTPHLIQDFSDWCTMRPAWSLDC